MESLILVIKGFFIGVGKIIPGVSGSLLAIVFGVYDRVLSIISNFFYDIKNNIKYLFFLGIGILTAIISTSKLLTYLLNNYYIITMLFFIGLIIGGIPNVIKKTKLKFNFNIIYGIISFLFVVSLYFLKVENNNIINNYPFYIMILIGILDAATMIIPGISGTAIMMILGCYNTVLNMFGNVFMLNNIKNIFPFFIGVILGVIIISKIIFYLLKKYNEQTNYCIIGFTLSSVLLLLLQTFERKINFMDVIIGLILLILGFILSFKLEKR